MRYPGETTDEHASCIDRDHACPPFEGRDETRRRPLTRLSNNHHYQSSGCSDSMQDARGSTRFMAEDPRKMGRPAVRVAFGCQPRWKVQRASAAPRDHAPSLGDAVGVRYTPGDTRGHRPLAVRSIGPAGWQSVSAPRRSWAACHSRARSSGQPRSMRVASRQVCAR